MKNKKLISIAKEVVKIETAALKKLQLNIGKSFEKIIKTIINCKNGKIIISGVGKSGIIAKKMVRNFFFNWNTLFFFGCIERKSWRYGSNNF